MNKRIKEIDKQIKALKKEKNKIEKSIIKNSGTLQEKFTLWYNSSKRYYTDYLPDRDIFPKLRKYMDKHNFYERHHEYDISEVFVSDNTANGIQEDPLYFYINPSEWKEFYDTKEEYDTFVEDFNSKHSEILEEIMKGKLKSFRCDW